MADALKKGSLIRVNREAYLSSVEAKASAGEPPPICWKAPVRCWLQGDYAQLRFRQPVPDIWLRMDQLEAYAGSQLESADGVGKPRESSRGRRAGSHRHSRGAQLDHSVLNTTEKVIKAEAKALS